MADIIAEEQTLQLPVVRACASCSWITLTVTSSSLFKTSVSFHTRSIPRGKVPCCPVSSMCGTPPLLLPNCEKLWCIRPFGRASSASRGQGRSTSLMPRTLRTSLSHASSSTGVPARWEQGERSRKSFCKPCQRHVEHVLCASR